MAENEKQVKQELSKKELCEIVEGLLLRVSQLESLVHSLSTQSKTLAQKVEILPGRPVSEIYKPAIKINGDMSFGGPMVDVSGKEIKPAAQQVIPPQIVIQ